jgi:molybdopterin-guanine dinucleotide biosynthesis protein A
MPQVTTHSTHWEGHLPLKNAPFSWRSRLAGASFGLLNGNHFTGAQQIVFLDPAKKASLERKKDQLTQMVAFVTTPDQKSLWPFVEALPGAAGLPVFSHEDIQGVAAWLLQEMEQVPVLKGLVLAGGQSARMGEDKGRIDYHGLPQREHVAQLLRPFCKEVFLSVRPGQGAEVSETLPILEDTFLGLGPLGAILSAMREDPNAAWLVAACDLPLLDAATVKHLVESRSVTSNATAFKTSADAFPEPMLAIWEPQAYPELLQQLAHGWSCPRKYLIQANCQILEIPEATALTNVNTPEERAKALAHIRSSKPEF